MSKRSSYGQILKSSSIMGGAAGVNMLFGMVQTKFAAVLIGTAGVGMLANLTAIQGMIGTIAGLGIQSSAVRDVAEAETGNNPQATARVALTLRRICLLTGLLGAVVMIMLSPLLSLWLFANDEHTLDIALLGVAVFLANISGGRIALIQGTRRIVDLARVNVYSAAAGTVAAIVLYSWLGMRGIMPGLLVAALFHFIFSWHFVRGTSAYPVSMTWGESIHAARGMARLGFSLMWVALIAGASGLIINSLITRQLGLEELGIYSAAFALSGIFVNFILGAMGADYYPRLTSLAPDHEAMNRLVNEQTEIGLLLAVPGLLASLSLAPWIIHIFYSREFLPAAGLLQWFILGCLIRVIQWPMGFLQLALGKSLWFLFTQTLFSVLHLAMIWMALPAFGLEGVSIAFFLLYLISFGLIFLVSRHLTGFEWSPSCQRLIWRLLIVVAATFLAVKIFSLWTATILGMTATCITVILSMRGLVKRIGHEHRLTRLILVIPGMKLLCGMNRSEDSRAARY